MYNVVNLDLHETFTFENLNEVIEFFKDIYNTIYKLNPNVSVEDILDQYERQGLSIVRTTNLYIDLKLLLIDWS